MNNILLAFNVKDIFCVYKNDELIIFFRNHKINIKMNWYIEFFFKFILILIFSEFLEISFHNLKQKRSFKIKWQMIIWNCFYFSNNDNIFFFFFRILAYTPEKLQFVAEIRWAERDNGNIWVMSTKFQKFFKQEVNARDINIRIMRLISMQSTHKNPILNSFAQSYFPSQFYNNTINVF